jgi:hypothetical protein
MARGGWSRRVSTGSATLRGYGRSGDVRQFEHKVKQAGTVTGHLRRHPRGRWAVIAGMVSAVVVIVACGNGDDGDDRNDVVGATPTVAAEGSPTPAPPEVDGQTYTFHEKGYAVDAPEGWRFEPNYLFDPAGSQYPQDALFHEDVIDDVQPNMAIGCLIERPGQETSEEFREARRALAEQTGTGEVTERELMVSGLPAYALDYRQELRDRDGEEVLAEIDKTDVVLVSGGCRWILTFTAPSGYRGEYQSAFDALVDSFRLLE